MHKATPPLKKYKISQEMIAQWLGYSTTGSFKSSTAHDRIVEGLESMIEHVENIIRERI